MGWLSVSKQDLQRIEVLGEIVAGRRTTESAAAILAVSVRQAQRLLSRYKAGGGALIHQARGRASNRQLSAGIREYAAGELLEFHVGGDGMSLAE